MALVQETGAVVAGAESYASVTDADTYHAANNNAAWALVTDEAVKEAALRKAARYIDGHYRPRWKGRRVQPVVQPLEWPRAGVDVDSNNMSSRYFREHYDGGYGGIVMFPADQIPQRLKDAQCELALRALSGELASDAAGGIKRKKIDVLETEYFAGASGAGQTVYTEVEYLLSDYLIPPGSTDMLRG